MSIKDTPPSPAISTLASRGIQPRFGALGQSLRRLAMNRLAEHLGIVFAQADDTLFECAQSAENNQVQALFFDSMQDIRKQRPLIERSYHQFVGNRFDAFLGGIVAEEAAAQPSPEELSLVGNEDYEETLQINAMAGRVKERCASSLYGLDRRLAWLTERPELHEDSSPFAPAVIAQGFREAMTSSPFPLRIKTILYTLFEQHVMFGLDSLYDALNQRLVEDGILPELKYTPQRAAQPARPATPGSTPAKADTSQALPQPVDLDGAPPQDPALLLRGLTVLLSEQRRLSAPAMNDGQDEAPETLPGKRSFSADELIEVLNRLQAEMAEELGQRITQPQDVETFRDGLRQQLDAGSTQPGAQKLTEEQLDIIDLVGMLFEFIRDDENLPDSSKTVLSHLHTPYLKVALQDKALFTDHHHPARRLLNAMAQAGALYGGDGDGDDQALLAKQRWVVEQVARHYRGDMQLFERLLDEFNDFIAALRNRVELRERRAVEAIKGRERLLAARQQAVEAIARALDGKVVPSIISDFLQQTWTDVLVFVSLRHGDQSPQWQRACEVAQELAWSGTPLDEEGAEHLQSIRLTMLDDLKKGLELLGGHHEAGIRRLLQDLVACQHAVQANQPQIAATLNPALPESPLGMMLGADATLPGDRSSTPLSQGLAARVQDLERLEFGTWFEFLGAGQPRLLKVSWFSPTTRNYMFVDHSGQRVAVKPIVELAQEMERGEARIVMPERGAPLIDRAMSAIFRFLQRLTGRSVKDHQGSER
ncbi:DUF1631 domain-containing protein [Stutzerimonas azotifigens]|uniref:DUF1631 domain-containing protein n=1 Tax=Stutzerimonas azotifigens TaxID=291995 RepID=A0ABR5Z5S5_9GAMM|nr:DUF1631 domain-containing protein [Stutzerimonas azotifigens]MBA1275509.1 DUF1631 domain-containing protein [Stutzerimonas azotifigens]